MKSADILLVSRAKKRGAALIIVLFFVVLLTALTVAFLSRSMTAHQASSGSVSEVKANVMANSACEIILGDLKQEIVDGSTTTAYAGVNSSGTAATYNVYTPKATASGSVTSTATPAIVGFTPTFSGGQETDGLANLVKVSLRNAPFYSNTTNTNYSHMGITRASAVNSASDASLNGRVITASRWNSHYLINHSQIANFPNPDWVIVTRNGANTAYTNSQISTLRDPTNANYAIGRFAYAIYNEGGLLDMNAAGHPSTLPTQLVSQKGSTALADLSQLPTSVSPANPASILTTQQIDDLVGWRNAYTSQLSSTQSAFGSVTFNSTTTTNWFNNFVGYNIGQTNSTSSNRALMKGFMGANTNAPSSFWPTLSSTVTNTSAPSDQVFLSRQQLISLTQSLGISTDALQYLGTFSRSLEQPSYTPDPGRPTVLANVSGTLTLPQVGGSPNESSYDGNNDAVGGDNSVNPAFLSIRVATAFTRQNGTTAVVGEPLVKTRFPLSRLAWVAYNATSSGTNTAIYNNFGLTRATTSSPWVYNHGQNSIMTLSKVAALTGTNAREPDFAELLKAAITVGALGKGAPNFQLPGGDNFEYTIDTAVDYQVLQIMANLIDQQDADSYPTWIQIASGPNGATNIYGVEDLPYLYRQSYMTVVETAPTTPLSTKSTSLSNQVTIGPTGSGGSRFDVLDYKWTWPGGVKTPLVGAAAKDPITVSGTTTVTLYGVTAAASLPAGSEGKVGYMYVVQLWNPHDANTAAANSATQIRPSLFRLVAKTNNPSGTATTYTAGGTAWEMGMVGQLSSSLCGTTTILPESDTSNNSITTSTTKTYWPISAPLVLTATGTTTNTALDFSDSNGTLFREPTMLWHNVAGMNLAGEASTIAGTGSGSGPGFLKDANTGITYYGIIVGETPMQIHFTITTTGTTSPGDGSYIAQVNTADQTSILPTANKSQQITFSLQYKDYNGNWIDYDDTYSNPNHTSAGSPSVVLANDPNLTNSEWLNPIYSGQMVGTRTVGFDPRTERFGVESQATLGNVSSTTHGGTDSTTSYLLENTANTDCNVNSTTANTAMQTSNFSVFETQRPRADKGNSDSYNNPGNVSGSGVATNPQMHLFSGNNFSSSSAASNPTEFDGLMSQNSPTLTFDSKGSAGPPAIAATPGQHFYFEDADGIARRSMGAYADTTMTDPSTSSLVQPINSSNTRIGLPLATANSYPNDSPVGTALQQSQSRPIILNRPFRSVSEMSYTFTGSPWKNIDFFTPESGYVGLLDTFCVGEPPANGLVAGKVDLNTRQEPVIQALVAGANRDEWYNATTPPTYALPPLTGTEATNVAKKLIQYTQDTTDYWRGPLANLSNLVGRYIGATFPASPSPSVSLGTDWYTYTYSWTSPTTVAGSFTYAGFTGLLDSTVYNDSTLAGSSANYANSVSPVIQRFHEAALRPLVDSGQTRVWNLLIDVVAQTGHYSSSATTLSQFSVDGEKRVWLHVAIDRYTGQILDKQIEVVAQ